MTKKAIITSNKLETLAEKAGGYVIPPWEQKRDPKGEENFAKMRRYSLRHKIPMSKLSDEDYRKMGITK